MTRRPRSPTRGAGLAALVDPLALDVVLPLMQRLTGQGRARADAALDRWAHDADPWLRRAALLVSGQRT